MFTGKPLSQAHGLLDLFWMNNHTDDFLVQSHSVLHPGSSLPTDNSPILRNGPILPDGVACFFWCSKVLSLIHCNLLYIIRLLLSVFSGWCLSGFPLKLWSIFKFIFVLLLKSSLGREGHTLLYRPGTGWTLESDSDIFKKFRGWIEFHDAS